MSLNFSSAFLGPAGENADIAEKFILEAFRDHVFWRRNFHPQDGPFIREADKRSQTYDDSMARLRQELYYLLSRLKQGAPSFSPRYIAHMTTDVTIASMVGYFAAMLYNPNNISEEASPVTTELELEVGRQLANLVGYGPNAWGHLTSGGSVANLEALWAARALKYFPPNAAMAARSLDLTGLPVRLAGGGVGELKDLDAWQLMNVPMDAICELREALLIRAEQDPRITDQLNAHSLGTLGYLRFHRVFEGMVGEALPEPLLIVPGTKHYSWVKIADLLGMGQHQLLELAVDDDYRIDPAQFAAVLDELVAQKVPVLAMVSVLGSTETGTVDALHRLFEAKRETKARGLDFYCHVDGAYGGYAAAMFRDEAGDWMESAFDMELARSFQALQETDSITIDPHKLGYAPYPAGAIMFQDVRVREFLTVAAPYVFHEEGGIPHTTIGKYIVEGSKPGAAAAAVWLNHRVLPLNTTGFGTLIEQTTNSARQMKDAIKGFTSPHGFKLVPLNDPDLNLVVFIAIPPGATSLAEINRFNEELYQRFAINLDRLVFSYDFLLSKTEFDLKKYGRGVRARLHPSLLPLFEDGKSLTVLRSTIMNPFVPEMMESHGFFEQLLASFEKQMLGAARKLGMKTSAGTDARPSGV